MGRLYQVPIAFAAQTAQIDVFELTAAAAAGSLLPSRHPMAHMIVR